MSDEKTKQLAQELGIVEHNTSNQSEAPQDWFDPTDSGPLLNRQEPLSVYVDLVDKEGNLLGALGTHRFSVLPRVGEVIGLWLEEDSEQLARVIEVIHDEVDPDTGVSEITLLTEPY